MKSTLRPTILFAFFLLAVLIIGCNGQIEEQNTLPNKIENTICNRKAYELADEFLLRLKKDNADTIVFYKRTCISCCDFFNIFWSVKGQRYLTKFYYGNMQSHSKTIALTTDKIFGVLGNNYDELKNRSISENSHKRKDGTSTFITIDHYCYSQMSIYTKHDSIITGRMKDHDFDEYTGFDIEPSEKKETNDSYLENINSKWNTLLITIENEIASMPEPNSRELTTLRTRKSER